jgi:hypothetical protein
MEQSMKSVHANFWLFTFAVVMLAAPADSHDGWIQINPIVETGQPVTIALMHGNHSNEHGSFRLAGKWDAQYTKLSVIEPSGETVDLTTAIVDLGEDSEKTGPKGPKGFHIAQFTPRQEGVHIVLARQERIIQDGEGAKLRTMRNARSSFVASAIPKVAEAQKATGYGRTHALDRVLEIVPMTNPFSVAAKGSITLKLLLNGTPAPNKTVTVISQIASAASAQDLKTNEVGELRAVVGSADVYLARAKFDDEERRPTGQLDKNSYEATYVFQVFNDH